MESEILDGTGRLADRLRRGDAPAASELYSDAATLLASGAAPLRGRAEVEAYWRAGLDLGLSELEFDVLMPWVASRGQPFHAMTDRKDTRRRIEAIIDRLRRGEDH